MTLYLRPLLTKKTKESFWDWFFRVTGISAVPRTKGDNPSATGDIYQELIAGGQSTRLTTTGGYSSPIAVANGDIWAINGDRVIRLSDQKSCDVPGVKRILIAKTSILVIRSAGKPVSLLDPANCKLEPTPATDPDAASLLLSWETTYKGGIVLRHWRTDDKKPSNIYVKLNGVERVLDRVAGDQTDWLQPSLSQDGKSILYIRAKR